MLQVIKEPEFKKYNAQIVIRNYALIKAFGSSKRLDEADTVRDVK